MNRYDICVLLHTKYITHFVRFFFSCRRRRHLGSSAITPPQGAPPDHMCLAVGQAILACLKCGWDPLRGTNLLRPALCNNQDEGEVSLLLRLSVCLSVCSFVCCLIVFLGGGCPCCLYRRTAVNCLLLVCWLCVQISHLFLRIDSSLATGFPPMAKWLPYSYGKQYMSLPSPGPLPPWPRLMAIPLRGNIGKETMESST